MAEYQQLKSQNSKLQEGIKKFERCDPEKLNETRAQVKSCKEAAIRWTDNLFEIESYMKKNNPSLTKTELEQNFPILKDLDYPDQ